MNRLGFFLVVLLLVGWALLYSRVFATWQENEGDGSGAFPEVIMGGAFSDVMPETLEALQRPVESFHCPSIRLSDLAVFITDMWGFELVIPEAHQETLLSAERFSRQPLCYILTEILRPHGLGFLRQEEKLHVIPMEEVAMDTGRRKVVFPVAALAGRRIDVWVQSRPIIQLAVTMQALHNENTEGLPPVGIQLEGYRNGQRWFLQNIQTEIHRPGTLQLSSSVSSHCTVEPLQIVEEEDSTLIQARMEFSYGKE